jgi:hypothetical protein
MELTCRGNVSNLPETRCVEKQKIFMILFDNIES